MLTFEPGTMVRNLPIVVENGDYLLPVYHEIGKRRADQSGVRPFASDSIPRSRTWDGSRTASSRSGNIQPAPAVVSGNHLVACAAWRRL